MVAGDAKLSKRAKLVFFHLPKTGGTTLHDLLVTNFKPEDVCPARQAPDMARLREEDLERFSLFSPATILEPI